MTVSELQKKPAKTEAEKKYNFDLLNWIFEGVEDKRRNKNMKDVFRIKYKYFTIDAQGNFEEYDEALPEYFDYSKPFYLITDLDYARGTLQDDDLCRRIEHIALDGPVQLMYCPWNIIDLDFIFTMNPDVWIAGVYGSTVIEKGRYAGKKCGYHFFADNKKTHHITREELLDKFNRGYDEYDFIRAVEENPEIEINDKGRVIRYKAGSRAAKILDSIEE